MYQYLYNICVWLSLGINTISGGSPYQPFSARLYYWFINDHWGALWAVSFVDTFLGVDHCEQVYVEWVSKSNPDQEG